MITYTFAKVELSFPLIMNMAWTHQVHSMNIGICICYISVVSVFPWCFSVRIEKGWLKIKFAIRGKRKKNKDRFLDPYFVAGAWLEQTTFGLWAQRATNCSIPQYQSKHLLFCVGKDSTYLSCMQVFPSFFRINKISWREIKEKREQYLLLPFDI